MHVSHPTLTLWILVAGPPAAAEQSVKEDMSTETLNEAPVVALDPPAVAMAWSGVGVPHEPREVAQVPLAPGDVVVEIELATVCGSDVHTAAGHRGAPVPLVLGHEQLGRITHAGADATDVDGAPLRAGQRVVWSLTVQCGACDRCLDGLPNKCRSLRKYGHQQISEQWTLNGGFGTHTHVLAGSAVVVVPLEVPAEVLAPASCGTATACAAVEAAGEHRSLAGRRVLIGGAGLIGLTSAALLRELGALPVVVDPDAARRRLALAFGAEAAVTPGEVDGQLFAAAIEASGHPASVSACIAALDIGATAVLVGSVSPSAPVAVDPSALVLGQRSIRGVHNYRAHHLRQAVGFLTQSWQRYPVAELVGQSYRLADLDEAISAATSGGAVRVGVRP